jgi:tetratricopeptide (TPR) repeat protein
MANAQYVLTVHAPGYLDYQQNIDLLTTSSDYVTVSLIADPSANTHPALPAPMVLDARVPPEARTEFEKGRALVYGEPNMTRLQEGLRHLERAVEIYPQFLEACVLLGLGYLDAQDWEKAEQTLRHALEINPKASTAHFALGEAYRRQKKYDEAVAALTAGLRLDERSYRGHYELGRTYFERGDIVKAGPQVGRALQLKPDFADGHLLAGNILLRAHQPENALVEFEEYLRLAPKGEYAVQARAAARKIKEALAQAKRR